MTDCEEVGSEMSEEEDCEGIGSEMSEEERRRETLMAVQWWRVLPFPADPGS